jgi:hypothetical protein
MCEELNYELQRGNDLAKQLIDHLEEMGADQCQIPVTKWDGTEYIVEVRRNE